MMPSAVVEIRAKYPPDPGKKLATIVDMEGTRYKIEETKSGTIQLGGVYELFWEDKEFRGQPWRHIQTVKAHQSKTAPAAAKVLGDVQRARTNEADANRMWVCALLGQSIQAGLVDIWTVTSMAQAGRNFLEAHNLIFSNEKIPEEKANGSQAKQPLNEEMGDDIPY